MKFVDFRSRSGFALVLVLIAIVLCATMVILLLERGTVAVKSASAYSHAGQVRALSEMAVNRVQAQIKDATTLQQKTTTPLPSRYAWASQPGAIRVFDENGNFKSIYKLYSSNEMLSGNADLSGDIPINWYSRKSEYTDLNEPVASGARTRYAIIDPSVSASLSDAIGITEGFKVLPTAPLEPENANPAPMPARWIYVLQDGTHCQLGDPRVDLKTNPIVGRIALWTDDETSKVNLNTASPATANSFWDAPRAYTSQERDLFSWAQPAQNEYQRYPGHPAMVSIRPILGGLSAMSPASYFALSPKYRWGGSEDGAKKVKDARTSLLSNKEDRTYASVDEFLFNSNPVTLRSTPTPQQIEALRFFVTTQSRAPELNLFGQPRVCIWPVYGDPEKPDPGDSRRTIYDRLIAFNSMIGGKPYYFTRENALSPTHDYDQINRNRELYGYLQRLTSEKVPGFGGSTFKRKYGDDRDQILTEIFDYIRIVNLNETYLGRASNFLSYTPDWKLARFDGATTAVNTGSDYAAGNLIQGAGLVTPIEIGDTRGMGRFPVIAEVGLLFVKHAQFKAAPPVVPEAPHPNNLEQLEAMLVIETITPAFGYMPWCGKDLVFELVSSDLKFGVGTREMEIFPASVLGEAAPIYYPPLLSGGFSPGGYDGASYIAGMNAQSVAGASAGSTPYRFFSPPLNLETGDAIFFITGGELKINIRRGGVVVQSYTLEFPNAFGLPLPVRSALDFSSYATTIGRNWWAHRFPTGTGPLDGDVLHSIQLKHGDARLISGQKIVPKEMFAPHPDYGKPVHFAHSMLINNNLTDTWNGASLGTYVDIPLSNPAHADPGRERSQRTRGNQPKIPPSIKSLRDKGWSGDFDNGWSFFPDGPFINKPDEGMMDTSVSGSSLGSVTPYETFKWSLADGLFSPLRQIPSAVMFGSLPTGVHSDVPWRTLLFCPNPADAGHKGFDSPPDFLLLDLFRMPVVEPFAISGPASTDGKINMNYAIAPYSYIRRASSWYALLETLKLFSVPDDQSLTYKSATRGSFNFRQRVDVAETLAQFETRFAANDIFRSASEICSLFLVPQGSKLADVKNLGSGFWSTHRLTGDNSREKPYAELYPKLTTQSNTYRIHLRVQVLAKSTGIPAGKTDFEPLAEYRGSLLIERYLDPKNARFSSVDPDDGCLNELYQFRVLESSRFAP